MDDTCGVEMVHEGGSVYLVNRTEVHTHRLEHKMPMAEALRDAPAEHVEDISALRVPYQIALTCCKLSTPV